MGALLGMGALLALAVAFSVSSDESAIDIARPRRRKRHAGALVDFHYVDVPFVSHRNIVYRSQVTETPSEIRAQIEKKLGRTTTSDAVSLATMIASEQGSDPPHVKAAIANAAVNYAKYKKYTDVENAITDGSGPARSFGGQLGRYASTHEPPTLEDLNIAEAVLSGRLPDTTGGAIQFDSPLAQLEGLRKKLPGYKKTPEQLAADRRKSGLEAYYLPGVDPMRVRFWRPKLLS
jgi:hypothetical protein